MGGSMDEGGRGGTRRKERMEGGGGMWHPLFIHVCIEATYLIIQIQSTGHVFKVTSEAQVELKNSMIIRNYYNLVNIN